MSPLTLIREPRDDGDGFPLVWHSADFPLFPTMMADRRVLDEYILLKTPQTSTSMVAGSR